MNPNIGVFSRVYLIFGVSFGQSLYIGHMIISVI